MKLRKKSVIVSFIFSIILVLILSYTLRLTSPEYALKITDLRGTKRNRDFSVTGKVWNRSPFELSDINIRFALHENSGEISYKTVHVDKLSPNTIHTFGPVINDYTYTTYGLPLVEVIEKEASPIPLLSNQRFRFFLTFLLIISISISIILLLYYLWYRLWYKNYSLKYGLRLIDKPTILSDSASEKGYIHNILMATLKNFSRREFSGIDLKFVLYLNTNEQIGTFEVHIDNLQPNKICKIHEKLDSQKYKDISNLSCELISMSSR